MTVAKRLPARTIYLCDICGDEGLLPRNGEPNGSWKRYSSVALDETCPDEAPTVCGSRCADELLKRIKDGRIRLPKLRATPGYFVVSKPKFGYPVIKPAMRTPSTRIDS